MSAPVFSLPLSSCEPGNGVAAPGVLSFAFPGVPGVACVFTTKGTGNLALNNADSGTAQEEVRANRARLCKALGLRCWSELRQVHGEHMEEDPNPTPLQESSRIEADAQCTDHVGLALLIKTADCQPVLLTDSKGTAVAALHVGWRGNLLNLPGKGVGVFCRRFGCAPQEVLAVRGPSLGPGWAEFVNFEREWPEHFRPWFAPGRKTMDLWSLTRHQLTVAGLRPENIFSLDLCTRSLDRMFFSYRRQESGRQMSLIWKIE